MLLLSAAVWHYNSSHASSDIFCITGKLIVPDEALPAAITVEYLQQKTERADNWQLQRQFSCTKATFALKFKLPAAEDKGTETLLRISYRLPGYLSQSKVIETYEREVDLGTHAPIPDTPANRAAYAALRRWSQSKTVAEAFAIGKGVMIEPGNPLFATYVAAQTMLALQHGDLNQLLRLRPQRLLQTYDHFWPTSVGATIASPFCCQTMDRQVGPFEATDSSLFEMIEAALGITRLPLLESSKHLMLTGYRQQIEAIIKQDRYQTMFDKLPIAAAQVLGSSLKPKQLTQTAQPTALQATDDYTAAIHRILTRLITLGPRKIGDREPRNRLATVLENSVPDQFRLERDTFIYPHSAHGSVTLDNFYLESQYQSDVKLLLCTHYDSFSGKIGDPGANNGLSGVAVLLYLLEDRLWLEFCRHNRIGLSFHYYDGETAGEPGQRAEYFLGSKHYVTRRLESAQKFALVLCSDMVGATFAYDQIQGSTHTNLTQLMIGTAQEMGAVIGKSLHIDDDHSIYHNLLKIPATLLIRYEYPHYHSQEDSMDKLNPYVLIGTASLLRNTLLLAMTAGPSAWKSE